MVIIDDYNRIRAHTEHICSPLEAEDYVIQVAEFASPAKWHLGHTTWFFETFILQKYLPDYQVFHPDFSFLFNSYYNAVGHRILRNHRGNMSRPKVSDIYTYRSEIDQRIRKFLQTQDLTQEILDTFVLGCQHEQQHQELLWTDLKYMFGHQPLFPVMSPSIHLVNTYNTNTGWKNFEGGLVDIGYDGQGFCYDNELGRHQIFLPPFALRTDLVTNKEYLEFITDGGYQQSRYWLDESWHWVQNEKITQPLYWHKIDHQWYQYTLSGLQPIDWEAQVSHVSHYEAWAFAEWKQLRLPTEFEWEAAADHISWGQRWEWTDSAYLPYPYFKKAAGAIGEYNGKFMVNQKVLRGCSTATSPQHSRKTYRNFFNSKSQWQFTGIRLAKHL